MKCPHCDTPIDEHEASLCLNAWVAEAVMGWEFVPKGTVVERAFLTLHRSSLHKGKTMEDLVKVPNGETYFPATRVPKYSAEIAAAWEVVLHHWPHGSASFTLNRFHSKGGDWECDYAGHEAESTAQERAPLAICRAALKGLGE